MKASKEQVQYRPADGPMRCSQCKNFAAPQSCTIVDGVIDPDGVSNAFEPTSDMEAANAPQPNDALSDMFSGPMTSR